MAPLDLSSTTVFLDFDGTITQHDSALHLLSRTAGDSWRAVEDLWLRGAIGSRECLQRQWTLVPVGDEQKLRRIVREVPLDPGFRPLVQALRAAGAEIVVLSDGYGFYAEEVCQEVGLALISNHIDWQSWSVTFPAISASCDCPGCGTCKPAAIRAAKAAGRTTVLVGDGASDRRGAAAADQVFATAGLAEWCRNNGLEYHPFDSLADVMEALVPARQALRPSHSERSVGPMYNDGQRQLQDRFDSRRIADRLEQVTVHTDLSDGDVAFIEASSMFFLATADGDGWPDVSYKGGRPGFVRCLDRQTIAFPSYDGNGMFRSLGNVLVNDRVALLFVNFEHPDRLRVHGTASVADDDPLLPTWDGAQAVVRVRVVRAFPNCPRYIHRMVVDQLSVFAPAPGHQPPEPEWKAMEVFRDYLPRAGSGDPTATLG